MKLLLLFYEFAKVGLFSVGGGLATVPFLQSMGEKTGWFTNAQLSTMIAVSESTPGPMGVNMATYVGYSISGIPGAVIATLGLITPSIAVFYGLRPASTALIASAGLSVAMSVFWTVGGSAEHEIALHWPVILLSLVIFLAMQHKTLKKIHPVAFIAAAAVVGAVFQF